MASSLQQLSPANAVFLFRGGPNALASYDWPAAICCVSSIFALITFNCIPTVDNIDPETITLSTDKDKADRRRLSQITYTFMAISIAASAYSFVTNFRLNAIKVN